MILLTCSIIIILMGLKFPESRKVTVVMLLFMWILYGFNYENPDYLNYYYDYFKIGRGAFDSFSFHERGYIYSAYYAQKLLGFDYQTYVLCSAAVSTAMLGYITVNLSKKPNIVLGLFMLNPYWVMICQVRFYSAFLFVLLGLVFLIKNDNIKGVILYAACIFAAGLFHISAWLCIVFLLVKRKGMKATVIGAVAAAAATVFIRSSFGMRLAERFLISDKKIANYMASETTRSFTGIMILTAVHVLILLTAVYFYHIIQKEGTIGEKKAEQSKRDEYILKTIIICTAFLPLECIDKNYERLFRIALFLFYALYGNYLSAKKDNLKNVPVGQFLCYSSVVTYYIFFYVSFTGWFEHVLVPVLNKNYIIDFFTQLL